MTKKNRLKICNWSLLITTVAILASGLQLEFTCCHYAFGIAWFHIITGIIFLCLIIWHLQLHFGWRNLLSRLRKQKSALTRTLTIVFLLMTVSAAIATYHWLDFHHHSPIGGIHGKIGFLMIILVICHTLKRVKFFL